MRSHRLLLSLLVSACVATNALAQDASARTSRFTLHANASSALPVTEISGLAWDADEQLLHAVSDRGVLFGMRVRVHADTLVAIEPVKASVLVDAASGIGLASSGRSFNAEGLAVVGGNDGRAGNSELLIALEEKPPQIARFNMAGELLQRLGVPAPADDRTRYRKKGRGLESVVLHPAFGLMTAPESPLLGTADALHTVYANGRSWSFERQTPGSRLKGIEVLPDGDLLVLERSRPGTDKEVYVASLRRVEIADCGAQRICRATPVALLPAGPENQEGLTLLDARHALLASDSGGAPAQGTVFTLVTLP